MLTMISIRHPLQQTGKSQKRRKLRKKKSLLLKGNQRESRRQEKMKELTFGISKSMRTTPTTGDLCAIRSEQLSTLGSHLFPRTCSSSFRKWPMSTSSSLWFCRSYLLSLSLVDSLPSCCHFSLWSRSLPSKICSKI